MSNRRKRLKMNKKETKPLTISEYLNLIPGDIIAVSPNFPTFMKNKKAVVVSENYKIGLNNYRNIKYFDKFREEKIYIYTDFYLHTLACRVCKTINCLTVQKEKNNGSFN